MLAWGTLAVYFSNLPDAGLRTALAVGFGLWGAVTVLRPRSATLASFLGLFVAILIWWLLIPPSNDRDWQPDVAVPAHATQDGDRITLHDVRNIDYRTETDYTVRRYDKVVELSRLRSLDLFLSYWGSHAIAHAMVSFGFGGDDYVAVSVEMRKEQGEDYSAVRGFFKQYELVYVIADERDVVRLRTNYRGEDVYLYRLDAPPDVARRLFLAVLARANALRDHPEWYNALTLNCTTGILRDVRPHAVRSWSGWQVLLTGHLDELAYTLGAVDQSLPFSALRALSRINERAQTADRDPAFSRRIREGLPGMADGPGPRDPRRAAGKRHP